MIVRIASCRLAECWEAWKDWDGYRFTTERSTLTNRRMHTFSLALFRERPLGDC